MSLASNACPIRWQLAVHLAEILSSKRQENRLAFSTAGSSLWPAGVAVRRRVRVGAKKAGSLGWHLHIEHPHEATSHGGKLPDLRQSGGNGRDRHSAHLGQRAGMRRTRRASNPPASTAASHASRSPTAFSSAPQWRAAGICAPHEAGHIGQGSRNLSRRWSGPCTSAYVHGQFHHSRVGLQGDRSRTTCASSFSNASGSSYFSGA